MWRISISLVVATVLVGLVWWRNQAPVRSVIPQPAAALPVQVVPQPAKPIPVVVVSSGPTNVSSSGIDWRAPGVDEEEANRLVGALVHERTPGMAKELAAIAHDPRHTTRWRNYAVQHLADLLATTPDVDGRNALEWAAFAEEPMVREAGVFGLARLSADNVGGFDAIARRAIEAALSHENPDQVRVAAIRGLVLQRRNEENFRLLGFVADQGEAPAVRVAAVDALGLLGDTKMGQALHQVRLRAETARDGEVFVAALERSQQRLQPSP